MKLFKEYVSLGPSAGNVLPIADLGDIPAFDQALYAQKNSVITKSDLDQIEKYADRLFAALGIDVEFTKHFMDRVNDPRNMKQITPAELVRLFKQTYKKYGKKISKLPSGAQAVINDMKTDINMPFVLNYKRNEIELIAKTVMRKKGFMTTSPKLSFESFVTEMNFFPKNLEERITLPTPPADLQKEADKLKKIIENRTLEDEESIRNHDENSFYAIEKYCEKHGLIFHDNEMKSIVTQARPTIKYFKEHFNVPRPHEVDSSIKPMTSKTNKTKAYPSGHACQSMLVALYVTEKFPEHEKGIKEAAKECGLGRVKAGFHYLADYVAGNLLAEKMFMVINKGDYGKSINEKRESFQNKLHEVVSADFAPIAHQTSLSKIIFSPAGYGTDTSATSTIRGGPGSVANTMWLPISGSIFKRVFPKQVRTTTFHVTNFKYFDQLYAIQNSRRSISTFANMDRRSIYQGIQSGSGLVVEVEGNVLAAAREDVMSIPELSGRRMMAFNFFRGPWGDKDVTKMQKGLEKLLKTLVNKYYTAFGDDYGNMVPSPRDDDFTKWRHIRAAYDQMRIPKKPRLRVRQAKSKGEFLKAKEESQVDRRKAGRIMQKIVKEYMDGVEKVFMQNAKQVQDTLTRYIERKKTDEQWDEIVVDDFNIKKVYIIEDSDELMPGDAEEFINQISLTKLPVARVYSHNMEEYARDIAQGKDVTLNTTVRDAYLDLVKDTPDSVRKEQFNEAPRIPRKKGQPAGSDKHSDLYTDENPRGTIHGLGFKDVETARASVKKIENSGKKHAHKIQAAIAMEQRAKEMGKKAEAAIYRTYIEKMKKITKQKNEKWSDKYKKSIDCNNPKGFSQRAHCQGRDK